MVIGPYAKQGYVSSVQYDHTSALQHIAHSFDLDPLNPRMAAANDLMDCIDMERLAAGDWADPIELASIDFNYTSSDETTGELIVDGTSYEWNRQCVTEVGSFRARDPISEWADAHPEAFGALDLRKEHQRYLRSISDYLRSQRVAKVR
jgi:hypothetical protein